jgi:hypothetical protein
VSDARFFWNGTSGSLAEQAKLEQIVFHDWHGRRQGRARSENSALAGRGG